jgi:hypothetical protein
LLRRLADLGAHVIGVDPGTHEQIYGVPIVKGFFPTPDITGEFDVIIAFGVLEHVDDPVAFCNILRHHLHPGGCLVLGVPDSEPFVTAGDLSCLFHEHWSYFDHKSLRRTIEAAHFDRVEIRTSGFGGLLYARAFASASEVGARRLSRPAGHVSTSAASERLQSYKELALRGVGRLASYISIAQANGEQVGIYVPGRIVNALYVAQIPLEHGRFFDDNPRLKGTYFPGLPIPVEDRESLVGSPTRHVLVMSRTFGEAIAMALRSELPTGCRIRTWRDLFVESGSHEAGGEA